MKKARNNQLKSIWLQHCTKKTPKEKKNKTKQTHETIPYEIGDLEAKPRKKLKETTLHYITSAQNLHFFSESQQLSRLDPKEIDWQRKQQPPWERERERERPDLELRERDREWKQK